MNKRQEKILIAALAGLVVAGLAVVAASPAAAAGYPVEHTARVSDVASWDQLNVRRWPASYSHKIGELAPGAYVWVERCNVFETGSDWCLVQRGPLKGWVNSRHLRLVDETDR